MRKQVSEVQSNVGQNFYQSKSTKNSDKDPRLAFMASEINRKNPVFAKHIPGSSTNNLPKGGSKHKNVPSSDFRPYNKDIDSSAAAIQQTDPGSVRIYQLTGSKSQKDSRVGTGKQGSGVRIATDGVDRNPSSSSLRKDSRTIKVSRDSSNRKADLKINVARNEGSPYTNDIKSTASMTPNELPGSAYGKNEMTEDENIVDYEEANIEVNEYDATLPESSPVNSHHPVILNNYPPSRVSNESPFKTNYEKQRGRPDSINAPSPDQLGISSPGDSAALRSPNHVRGAFMNEHISNIEFEKQKEKQRAMKEALDMQLNEKKRKLEEDKTRQKEEHKREEERIRREVEEMKIEHEKELAQLNLKKNNSRNEENDAQKNALVVKPRPSRAERNEAANMQKESKVKKTEEEPLYIPPEPKVKEASAQKKHGSPTKESLSNENLETDVSIDDNINTLADENKKLRDENLQKEELISALLSALKSNHSSLTNKNMQDSAVKIPRNKESISSHGPSNEKSQTPTYDAVSEVYGYYLNKFSKSRVRSDNTRDLSLSHDREKEFSLGEYNKTEPRDYMPKTTKTNSQYVDPIKITGPNQNPFYRPFVPPGVKAEEYANPSIMPSSNRGYSSPMATSQSKNFMSFGLPKTEGKNPGYIMDYNLNSNLPPISPLVLNATQSMMANGMRSFQNSSHKDIISNQSLMNRSKRVSDYVETEPSHDRNAPKSIKSFRPLVNIVREDGYNTYAKSNNATKRDGNPAFAPSGNKNMLYNLKNLEIDSLKYTNDSTIRVSTFTPSNYGPKGYENGASIYSQHKDAGKLNNIELYADKYNFDIYKKSAPPSSDVSPIKLTRNEDNITKIQVLPALDNKSKFPKDVFAVALKKRPV